MAIKRENHFFKGLFLGGLGILLVTVYMACSSKSSPTAPNNGGGGQPSDTPTLASSFTPTSTSTSGFSSTPTNTSTSTAADTSTATTVPTNTATSADTSTPTDTTTNTPTVTPTDTLVNTATSTLTPTDTTTNTPTATPTDTLVNTATATLTDTTTDTVTSTLTPVFTSTPTLSETPTATFTSTFSPTPTYTSTSTTTSTDTPTVTLTATSTATGTPTPETVSIQPSQEPTAATYLPGASGVTVLLVSLTNSGTTPVSISYLAFNIGGTGNTADISAARLYRPDNSYVGMSGSAAITFIGLPYDTLAGGATKTYALVFDFGASASGTYTAAIASTDVSVSAAYGVNVTGALTSPQVTIAAATSTFTPTFTPTSTSTFTATDTPTSTATGTPTPLTVTVIQPTQEPTASTYLPASAGVTAMLVNLANSGSGSVSITYLVFTVAGTGVPASDIGTVKLFNNSNPSTPLALGTFHGNSVTLVGVPLDTLAGTATNSYTLTYDFQGSNTGTYTTSLSASGVSVTSATGINVAGSATGPQITIATATATFTPTQTATFTVTSTPTSTATSTTTFTVTSTPTSPYTVPDANLRLAIMAALGTNTPTPGATIPDLNPTVIATVGAITANNAGITSIQGLQYAVNLTTLNLANTATGNANNITDLSPLRTLSQTPGYQQKLYFLLMDYNNNLGDLSPVTGLTNLQRIELRSGTPGGADAPGALTSIAPVSALSNLFELEISGQPVADLSPLAGPVSTKLTQLYLQSTGSTVGGFGNSVTVLSNLKAVTVFFASSTDFSDLSTVPNGVVTMWVGNDTAITDISSIKNWTNARVVVLAYDTGINPVVPALPNLGSSSASVSLNLTGDGITDISNLATPVPGLNKSGSVLNISQDTGIPAPQLTAVATANPTLTIIGP